MNITKQLESIQYGYQCVSVDLSIELYILLSLFITGQQQAAKADRDTKDEMMAHIQLSIS